MSLTSASTGGPPTAPGIASSRSRGVARSSSVAGLPAGRLIAEAGDERVAVGDGDDLAQHAGVLRRLELEEERPADADLAERGSSASIRGRSSKKSRSAAEFGQLRLSAT